MWNDKFRIFISVGGICLLPKQAYQSDGLDGRLPPSAPLATPYVPFQLDNPPKYEAKVGLIRGTLYPGLDLPFMGMENQEEKEQTPMQQLQALGFAMHELALYLDTHREDTEAINQYASYQKIYQSAMHTYEEKYGPLTHSFPSNQETYRWLDDPWPWEYRRD